MELASLVDCTPDVENIATSQGYNDSPLRTDTWFASKNNLEADETHVHKLNWLNGVAMPTCENMWGVIIFLRFFYIVG